MLKELYRIAGVLVVMTVLTGVAYPYAVTGLAGALFPHQAGGSLVLKDGKVIGSTLIGQTFTGEKYFHARPSAAGKDGYDAAASSGSNLGPASKVLIARVAASVAGLKAENPGAPIPADLVTASGSGLDPHISPAAAAFQMPRVAGARGMTEDTLRAVVAAHTESRTFGVLGEPRVNVLRLNLALDALNP